MKKIIALLAVLFIAVPVFAVENPWDVKLPFKNGTIHYTLSGSMKGDKTIYVKDYGRTTAEYSNTSMTMMGFTQQQKELIITTPEWEYTIDLMEGAGTKQANPEKYFIEEFNKLSKSEQKKVVTNAEKTGYSMVEGMDGDIQQKAAEILGYKCDKVTMAGTVAYTIHNTDLPLKIEGSTMGIKVSEVATKVDKGTPPSARFKVPANIRIEHDAQADQMMQAQAKTVIRNLLDGKQPAAGQGAGNYQGSQGEQNSLTPEQQGQMKQLLQMFNNN